MERKYATRFYYRFTTKIFFINANLIFEEFLKSRNHPYRSMYVNHKDVEEKLFHTFNVIRPDYEISKKINLEMIAYFNELAEKEKKAKKSKKIKVRI